MFKAEDISKFGDGSSPLTHANIDLVDLLFSKGLWNSDNLSVSGGSERGTYNVSLGHIYEGGIINQTGLKKYTLRTNLDYKATSKLNIGVNIAGTLNQIKDPGAGVNWITHIAFREWANDVLQFPDGRWSILPGRVGSTTHWAIAPMPWVILKQMMCGSLVPGLLNTRSSRRCL